MTELIIGRQAGVERPRLIIQHEGKSIPMGEPGSVPMNVSRRHCLVRMDDNLNISIEDLTTDNFMFVNGVDCKRKKNIKMDDVIELGPDRYRLDLESIIKYFTAKRSYHIGHLQKIYDDYKQTRKTRKKRQDTFNAISSIPMVFTMGSFAIGALGGNESSNLRTILYPIGFAFLLIFIGIRLYIALVLSDKTDKQEDDFREKYRCPNPSCNHYLGQTPYKELLQNKTCPYCKAKFEE